MSLSERIRELGKELVVCDGPCGDVAKDFGEGVLPRCLVLEYGDIGERGCVIVGMNPGQSPRTERDFYLKHGSTYEAVMDYWVQQSPNIQYNQKLQRFLNGVGFTGPRLWTEVAKCENAVSGKNPSLQTMRQCARRFLFRELEAVPPDWPLLGVGKDAYVAVAYLVADRTVIGIPHPTGSWGRFAKLMADGGVREGVREQVEAVIATEEPKAVWLGSGTSS